MKLFPILTKWVWNHNLGSVRGTSGNNSIHPLPAACVLPFRHHWYRERSFDLCEETVFLLILQTLNGQFKRTICNSCRNDPGFTYMLWLLTCTYTQWITLSHVCLSSVLLSIRGPSPCSPINRSARPEGARPFQLSHDPVECLLLGILPGMCWLGRPFIAFCWYERPRRPFLLTTFINCYFYYLKRWPLCQTIPGFSHVVYIPTFPGC